MDPEEIPPWRECPFKKGGKYRVKMDLAALRSRFACGENLVFEYDAWSRYDGITGYFFKDEKNVYRVWDIADDEDIEIWQDYFEAEQGG